MAIIRKANREEIQAPVTEDADKNGRAQTELLGERREIWREISWPSFPAAIRCAACTMMASAGIGTLLYLYHTAVKALFGFFL